MIKKKKKVWSFSGGEENVLKQTVVMVAWICENL